MLKKGFMCIPFIYSQQKMRINVEEINGDYQLIQKSTNVKYLNVKTTY